MPEAPRKNKRPNPGINHPESHAAIVSRAQLDCTTAESVARFDRGVAHEAVAGASEGDLLRWLDEVQLTRRRPWTGIVGVQAQVGEDSRDGVCLHHHGEQLSAATAVHTPMLSKSDAQMLPTPDAPDPDAPDPDRMRRPTSELGVILAPANKTCSEDGHKQGGQP